MGDVIIGGVFLGVAIFLYVSTLWYPPKSAIVITPGTWPRFIAYLMGALSVILVVRGIIYKRQSLNFKRIDIRSIIIPGLIVISIIIYIIVWSQLRRFFLPTFVLVTLMITLLKQNKRFVDYLMCAIAGLGVTVLIYCVFYYVFRLPL